MYVYEDNPSLNSEIENIYHETGNIWKTTAKARAYLPTSSQILATATPTKINLTAENYDLGNNFNTTLKRFIAPIPGYYLVAGAIKCNNLSTSGDYLDVYIYKNGSLETMVKVFPSQGEDTSVAITDIIHLDKDDYIELWAEHDAGLDRSITNGTDKTFMAIHILSKD